MTAEIVFWACVFGVLYPYLGYPLALLVLGKVAGRRTIDSEPPVLPSVSMIIPVHNEAARIAQKLANTAALDYPQDRLQVLFISDGSTDRTVEMVRAAATPVMSVIELPARKGKAAGLNAGLEHARNEILVFSDASIQLEPAALKHIVRPFQDPEIGCVSGEDRIAESGGEGYYGRYELTLRRLESRVHSIVGASGSFYAQRRAICAPFTEGMAPDFLSVLRTLEQGYRAISEPSAVGAMTSVKDPRHEFERKVRTLIRGMTTLFAHARVLDPFRFGLFAFAMWSHKVLRWTAPFFLVGALVAPIFLLDSRWYAAFFVAQVAFYLGALAAFAELGRFERSLPGKVALYFSSTNTAILAAWIKYGMGVRQELWTPSRR
ncbi:MAG TPA: glycosyltransferase family 2 protein [Vicinamibacterales bacterium]|nr:glycosyltransferase family 2 protein [Vicinamibacterales bacterium]